MDPQRRAIALGKAYEEIWECDRPAPVMEAPPGGFPRDWIPPISIQTLREVAKTFRRDRAVSLDNLRPKHVELLSGDALESLVALFHLFERLVMSPGACPISSALSPRLRLASGQLGQYWPYMRYMKRLGLISCRVGCEK